jgi:hypothetical protein
VSQWHYRPSFGLEIGFIDHLIHSRLVTTLNHSGIAPHFTNHAKSFPARSVFTSTCLVTASNNGYSSASRLKSSLNSYSLPTVYSCFIVLFITPLHRPSRKHSFQQYIYCCMRIRCRGNVFTELLPRNGSTRYNILRYEIKTTKIFTTYFKT